MSLNKTFKELSKNPWVVMPMALVGIVTMAILMSNDSSTGTYHIKTWTEMMAERNASLVTENTTLIVRNTQSVCTTLYESNATVWDGYGIRCIRNDPNNNMIYDKYTCGPNGDEWCDCICYL